MGRLGWCIAVVLAAGCGGASVQRVERSDPARPPPPAIQCDFSSYVDEIEDAQTAWTAFWGESDGDEPPAHYYDMDSILAALDDLGETLYRITRLHEMRVACGVREPAPALESEADALGAEILAWERENEGCGVSDDDGDCDEHEANAERRYRALLDAINPALDAARRAVPEVARGWNVSECERATALADWRFEPIVQEANREYHDQERVLMDSGSWDERLMDELHDQYLKSLRIATLIYDDPRAAFEAVSSTHLRNIPDLLRDMEALSRACRGDRARRP
jgi:hypothetical protein